MNKIFLKVNIVLVTIIFLTSCEQTVDNPQLPYKEQLVIRGVLEAGKKVEGIEITKTLPPLDPYSYKRALVKDAQAVIKSNGVSYPLIYDSYSERYFTENLIPEIGKKYFLEVSYKNMIATASTIIPEPVEPDSFIYKVQYVKYTDYEFTEYYWEYYVYALYKPSPGSAYLAIGNEMDYYYVEDLKRTQDTLKSGKIAQYVTYYRTYDTNTFKYDIQFYTCKIDAFDQQFYNYYTTRWEGNGGDDIFGTSGVNVRGNIRGGIGLFIGTSPGKITNVVIK